MSEKYYHRQINKYVKYAMPRASLSISIDNPNLNVGSSTRVDLIEEMGLYTPETLHQW